MGKKRLARASKIPDSIGVKIICSLCKCGAETLERDYGNLTYFECPTCKCFLINRSALRILESTPESQLKMFSDLSKNPRRGQGSANRRRRGYRVSEWEIYPSRRSAQITAMIPYTLTPLALFRLEESDREDSKYGDNLETDACKTGEKRRKRSLQNLRKSLSLKDCRWPDSNRHGR